MFQTVRTTDNCHHSHAAATSQVPGRTGSPGSSHRRPGSSQGRCGSSPGGPRSSLGLAESTAAGNGRAAAVGSSRVSTSSAGEQRASVAGDLFVSTAVKRRHQSHLAAALPTSAPDDRRQRRSCASLVATGNRISHHHHQQQQQQQPSGAGRDSTGSQGGRAGASAGCRDRRGDDEVGSWRMERGSTQLDAARDGSGSGAVGGLRRSGLRRRSGPQHSPPPPPLSRRPSHPRHHLTAHRQQARCGAEAAGRRAVDADREQFDEGQCEKCIGERARRGGRQDGEADIVSSVRQDIQRSLQPHQTHAGPHRSAALRLQGACFHLSLTLTI